MPPARITHLVWRMGHSLCKRPGTDVEESERGGRAGGEPGDRAAKPGVISPTRAAARALTPEVLANPIALAGVEFGVAVVTDGNGG